MSADPRIAYDDLDAHPLMRAITDLAAHPGDASAAQRLAGALFSVETSVQIAQMPSSFFVRERPAR